MTNSKNMNDVVAKMYLDNLDQLINDVLCNPQSDDALTALVNGLPEASQDTLRAIVKSVIADKESS